MSAGWQFVTLYMALGGALAVAVARGLLPPPRGADPECELGTVELAVLNGGPPLAVLTAAAGLRGELAVLQGGGVIARGALGPDAGGLERELFAAADIAPGQAPRGLLRRAEDSPEVTSAVRELTAAGLLLGAAQIARLRRMWLFAVVLVCLGVFGVAGLAVAALAGSSDGSELAATALILGVVGWLAACCRRRTVGTTALGRRYIKRVRAERIYDVRAPAPEHLALAVALFGSGALWAADAAFAAALGVPTHLVTALGGDAGSSSAGLAAGNCGGCGGACGGCGCG